MVIVTQPDAAGESRRDVGNSIISNTRPLNPAENTSWQNPVTGLNEIFAGGLWDSQLIANALVPSNNLSDLISAATARTNLGLGTLATQNADSVNLSGRVRLGGQIAQSANYTIGATDCTVLATGGGGGITITLPAANTAGVIAIIIKVDAGAGAITVARAGSDTIEGATSISLAAQYNKALLISNGSGLWIRLL